MSDTRAIPVIDGEVAAPATRPFPVVDATCAWCQTRLRAVPAPYEYHAGAWHHPGCADAARKLASRRTPPC